MSIIYELFQGTYVYTAVLLVVALGGLLSERSGVTNIALEGIMIMGAFLGIWAIKGLQTQPYSFLTYVVIILASLSLVLLIGALTYFILIHYEIKSPEYIKNLVTSKQGKYISLAVILLLTALVSYLGISLKVGPQFTLLYGMIIGGLIGGLYSMIHAYAAVYLKANQIISATALNLFAPAFAIFTARFIQGGQQIIFNSQFMIREFPILSDIPVLGDLLFKRTYLSFYFAIGLLLIILLIINKTKFGLRLKACGENPHAADSLGIDIYKTRFIAVVLSGVFAGMGGVIFVATTSAEFSATVDGFGFLAIAVLIFGNWKPTRILLAALFFGFMRTLAAKYSLVPIIKDHGEFVQFYNMIPYITTIIILAFFSKNSKAPKALGEIYDKGKR
jgi:simple sugar transport system permease protein